MSAEKLEAEAEAIIRLDILKLPAGLESGTARALVRLLLDAAVARIQSDRDSEAAQEAQRASPRFDERPEVTQPARQRH